MDYDDNVEGNNHDDDDNDDDEVGDDNEDGDSDDDDNDVDDDDDGVDDDGDDDDEVFEAPSAGQFTVCAADLDSCIVPMKTSELETLFPSLQMATLVNHPVFIKDLKDVICVAEFGYKLFITRINLKTKAKIARRLYDLGVTVNTHKSPNVLMTSRMTIGLHILARGLMGGGIRFVYLAVYGMKIPLYEMQRLTTVETPPNPPPAKFDIGVNVETPFIPLFKISSGYRGTVYPMFLNEYGSVQMKLPVEEDPDLEVDLKCYPRVLHAIKASGVTMDIPCTNLGMKKKLEFIKKFILEILSNSMMITGFRTELCFKGNLSLSEATDLFRNYRLVNGVPEGIEIAKYVSTKDYKQLIQFVYMEHQHIGRGRASSEPTVDQKASMGELLNSIGYFSTKFERLLQIRSQHINEPNTDMTPRPEEMELQEIKDRVKTRKAARNNLLICATLKGSGGCTRAFQSIEELSMHILETFGSNWRESIVLQH